MSDAAGIMFGRDGRPTALLLGRWRAKAGRFQPQGTAVYLAADRTATAALRALWAAAFPSRRRLPLEPLVDRDGRFTPAMLNVWS